MPNFIRGCQITTFNAFIQDASIQSTIDALASHSKCLHTVPHGQMTTILQEALYTLNSCTRTKSFVPKKATHLACSLIFDKTRSTAIILFSKFGKDYHEQGTKKYSNAIELSLENNRLIATDLLYVRTTLKNAPSKKNLQNLEKFGQIRAVKTYRDRVIILFARLLSSLSDPQILQHIPVLTLAKKLDAAVKHIHAKGVVINTIAPENIYLTNTHDILFSDLSQLNVPNPKNTSHTYGVARFSPPESLDRSRPPKSNQLFFQRKVAADMYALGCTLLSVSTKKPLPWEKKMQALVDKRSNSDKSEIKEMQRQAPSRLLEMGVEINTIPYLSTLLAMNPDDRLASPEIIEDVPDDNQDITTISQSSSHCELFGLEDANCSVCNVKD